MDSNQARSDLDFVKRVMQQAGDRIDARAFHFVHWGLIVAIWYPLANWFQHQGKTTWLAGLGIGSIALGFLVSWIRETRLRNTTRLPGENSMLGRQIGMVVAGCIAGGIALSAIAPATQFVEGPNVPILWGLVYANLMFVIGVLYNRDFIVGGVFIFLGSVAAMFLQEYNGYILGPVMGLGVIIPALRAEARLRRQRNDEGAANVERASQEV